MNTSSESQVKDSHVWMASPQRDTARAAKADVVDVVPIDNAMPLTSVRLSLTVIGSANLKTVDANEFRAAFVAAFDRHVFQEGHQVGAPMFHTILSS